MGAIKLFTYKQIGNRNALPCAYLIVGMEASLAKFVAVVLKEVVVEQ